ncbi:MAG TPA: 4a-hydroxytetrahydrobiopterin dehydratase [Patescibacteria group bacterium]|jgi:4a-hydroxytetrahydrobiopterin dehydratase|nr:4a-hydroxytetrahydrobiopterin dehydratase [Patescibacteria group bacterium]
MKLTDKKCIPCEAGTPPLKHDEIQKDLKQLSGWKVIEDKKLIKNFKFPDFIHTMGFASAIALLAQEEGHHPDLQVSYGKLTVELSTHAIKGLSENDFILAAKIDQI